MSYDLLVFDPDASPRSRAEFMEWYRQQTRWSELHGYNDPDVPTPALRGWFRELIQTFPPMNGPLGVDDCDNPMVTDYSLGQYVIYAAFSWSQAERAYKCVLELAGKHRVGFFDVSSTAGSIWLPLPDGRLIEVNSLAMHPRRSSIVSRPITWLIASAIGALVLNAGRQWWASKAWFPIVVGLVAAMAIVAVQHLLTKMLLEGSGHRRRMVVWFAMLSVISFAGSSYIVSDSIFVAAGLFLMSAIFMWAALGTALEWPGFRPPAEDDECPNCRYNIRGNATGICPECGASIPPDPEMME